jgi:hypothetical protein
MKHLEKFAIGFVGHLIGVGGLFLIGVHGGYTQKYEAGLRQVTTSS